MFSAILCNVTLLTAFQTFALCKEIKIGLTTTQNPIIIGSDQNSTLINLQNNKVISKVNKLESYEVHNINGFLSISHKLSNTSLGTFSGPVKLISDKKNGLVCCNKKWYRGQLTIFTNPDKKSITIVNNIDLEDYLSSVVPSEIPFKWHKEVLKAQ